MRQAFRASALLVIALAVYGCEASNNNKLKNVVGDISECGGFASAASALLTDGANTALPEQCSEVLSWSYVPATQSLSLTKHLRFAELLR